MLVNKGDFVFIDYIMRIKETGEVFDTTSEEEARKGRIFKDQVVYEPILVVVGEGWILKALDDSLPGMEVGKKEIVEILPEKAFGQRDPSQVRTIPIRRFKEKKVYPGAQIEINGKLATVNTVGAGRVRVDFNPPLAGRTLVYDLTIKGVLVDRISKVKALIHRRISSVEVKNFKFVLTRKVFKIEIPRDAFYVDGIQFAKRGIATDLQKFFPEVESITFIETFKKEKPQTTDVKSMQ